MQEFYKTVDSKSKNYELEAKIARKMTNDAIINLIKDNVFNKIAETAKKGECSYSFNINRNIDYQVGIVYLRKLGYDVNIKLGINNVYVTVKW